MIGMDECLIGENECAHGEDPTFFPVVICKIKLMRMDRLWCLSKDKLPRSECPYSHQSDRHNFELRYLSGSVDND